MGITIGVRLGPYCIIRKLGEGGMGEIYEARHETIERRVAIKVLHTEFIHEPEIANRFINEARAVNLIGHPGLVQVYDYSRHTDGRSYIVMEYLEGETLAARQIRCSGHLPIREAVEICRQIGSALSAAHEKEIVHRDLKPENVMLVPDREHPAGERIKLLDFGLAKLSDRPGTKSDVIMGTPHYMSPEQCRGAKTVTNRSDVYSLGVMLFELLAGRLPFTVEGAGELISMHLFSAPPPLASIAPDVPEQLTALVDSMLTKAPETRPSMTIVTHTLRVVTNRLPEPRLAHQHTPTSVQVEVQDSAFKPTLTSTTRKTLFIATPELRCLLSSYLQTDSEFDAFIIDYFSQLKRRFSHSMDRTAKVNLLLETVDRDELSVSLRRAIPNAFTHLIVIEKGTEVGRIYPLRCPGSWVIGRGMDAHIQLSDKAVSRMHAILDVSTAGIVARNVGKNPLLVNEQTVMPNKVLASSDRIRIGDTVFRLETVFQREKGGVIAPLPIDWTERTFTASPSPELEPETQAISAARERWKNLDKLLVAGNIKEAESHMAPRLDEAYRHALNGAIPDESIIIDMLYRTLKLAMASKKARWFTRFFDYARACKYKIKSPLLEILSTQLAVSRPEVGDALFFYSETINDEALTVHLKKLNKSIVSEKQQARQLLRETLVTDADLNAFCIDYFPEVARRFSGSMSTVDKENLLLSLIDAQRLIQCLHLVSS